LGQLISGEPTLGELRGGRSDENPHTSRVVGL